MDYQSKETNNPEDFKIHSELSKIPMGDSVTALKLNLQVQGNVSGFMDKHFIIILDNSGSMGGSAMTSAKEGIKDLITHIHKKGTRLITLVVYNTTAQIMPLTNMTIEECKAVVDKVTAKGRTSFCDAFSKIKTIIQKVRYEQLCIVFFTDGQDTVDTPEKVQTHLLDLAQCIQQNSGFSETHTIGFTADHDAPITLKYYYHG